MAQDSGFFNAQYQDGEYDRVYNAEQFAAYFASFISNGIFGGSMEELLPLARTVNNMSIDVSAGRAWINGWWFLNDETYNMPVALADGVLNRKDILVIRWGNSERDIWLQIIQGEPAVEAVAPTIRRDADYFDLELCEINVPAGTTKITQSQITDTRLDNTVCGLVTGVVDQIDTTSLYLQFRSQFGDFMDTSEEEFTNWYTATQTAFTNWMNSEKAEFDEWYAYIQTIIDESAVLHLQSEIDALDELEYTSSDILNPTSSESVDVLQSGESAVSRWQKVSKMFKNIRYILNQIGSTNISSIGSTITAAIKKVYDDLNNRGTNTYGTCSTAAATAAKVVTITNTDWKFKIGSRVTVKFTYTNTAQNPTLNVNGTGAKSIWYNTAVITTGSLAMAGTANRPMEFVYDGTYWVFVGWSVDNNTTYSSQSASSGGTTVSLVTTGEKYIWNSERTPYQRFIAVPTVNKPAAGWRRVCKLSSVSGYMHGIILVDGGYSYGAPGSAIIALSTMHTNANLRLLSNARYGTGMISQLRLVNVSGNVYWLDVYMPGNTEGEVTAQTITIFGNIKATEIQNSSAVYSDSVTVAAGVDIASSLTGDEWYTTSSTAAGTAAKTCNYFGFKLYTGCKIKVKFTNANTASAPTLNVNATGAKSIKAYGTTAPTVWWQAGDVVEFTYDGTNWLMSASGGQISRLYSSFSSALTSLKATAIAQAVGATGSTFTAVINTLAGIVNRGAVTKTLDTSTTSYTIPDGYHNGSGKVSISTQTKSASPSTSVQTISPDSGKVLSSVSISAMPLPDVATKWSDNTLNIVDGWLGSRGTCADGVVRSVFEIPQGKYYGGRSARDLIGITDEKMRQLGWTFDKAVRLVVPTSNSSYNQIMCIVFYNTSTSPAVMASIGTCNGTSSQYVDGGFFKVMTMSYNGSLAVVVEFTENGYFNGSYVAAGNQRGFTPWNIAVIEAA